MRVGHTKHTPFHPVVEESAGDRSISGSSLALMAVSDISVDQAKLVRNAEIRTLNYLMKSV